MNFAHKNKNAKTQSQSRPDNIISLEISIYPSYMAYIISHQTTIVLIIVLVDHTVHGVGYYHPCRSDTLPLNQPSTTWGNRGC